MRIQIRTRLGISAGPAPASVLHPLEPRGPPARRCEDDEDQHEDFRQHTLAEGVTSDQPGTSALDVKHGSQCARGQGLRPEVSSRPQRQAPTLWAAAQTAAQAVWCDKNTNGKGKHRQQQQKSGQQPEVSQMRPEAGSGKTGKSFHQGCQTTYGLELQGRLTVNSQSLLPFLLASVTAAKQITRKFRGLLLEAHCWKGPSAVQAARCYVEHLP